ncbi:sulfatase [Leptospira sp. GIMC2001]|uniref:sulfatase n=1 Tax=Leptospira sp. GIMC2001 TaxID=1513297 RepID=UPI0023499C1F|nr:sulfatase [Leptospira sp. GIMC2001]WCL48590.1 sulfatase [Leptospira sp. GIMC2001]
MESMVGEKIYNNKQNSKNRIQLVLVLFFLVFHLDCIETSQDLEKIAVDLTRELANKKTEKFGQFPQDKFLLQSYWKKNPGRFSGLERKDRWWNSQITFNTDRELFVNESKDSILIPPTTSSNSKISKLKIEFPRGSYRLELNLGILSDRISSNPHIGGILTISTGKLLLREIKLDQNFHETWKKFSLDLITSKDIIFEWESTNSYLVLGKPLLYTKTKSRNPNVILIVIDSARKDFLPDYGFAHHITPNISAIAKESIVFENPFSNGNWTKPSMISFFHSEYASNLGINNLWFATLPENKKTFYKTGIPSISEVFRRNGYETKSIMNNVFFLDYTTVGVDLGFHDVYQVGKDIEDTPILTNAAIQFVRENKNKQYFLHFNLNTPHGGYAPPLEFMQELRNIISDNDLYKFEAPIRRYMGELVYTDSEIGRLMEELKNLGQYEETMIIITGDHGELFDPKHDRHSRYILQGLYGHGESHFDEEINVPYIIKLPKSMQKDWRSNSTSQRRIPGQSSLLSLTPTVLGLAKLDKEIYKYRGVDYSKCIIQNTECPKEDTIYTEGRMSESIRTEDYKYIRRYQGYTSIVNGESDERIIMPEEYYDLKADPKEYHNLAQYQYIQEDELTLDSHSKPKNPNESKIQIARKNLDTGNFLRKNRFHIHLPACTQSNNANCRYNLSAYIPGGIYKVESPSEFNVVGSSSKSLTISGNIENSSARIKIHTVNANASWSGQISRDGYSMNYLLGRWGLFSKDYRITGEPDFMISGSDPIGFENSKIPWVYNDARLSGESSSETDSAMADEVRKILESWGYIHE